MIIAIVLGVGLGSVFAFFLMSKNKETKLETTKAIAPTLQVTPKATAPTHAVTSVAVSQPQSGDIVNKNNIDIQGKAPVDSVLVIQSPIKELTLKNDKEDFRINFPLAFGENVIHISAYAKNNTNPQEEQLKIYYLDEE